MDVLYDVVMKSQEMLIGRREKSAKVKKQTPGEIRTHDLYHPKVES